MKNAGSGPALGGLMDGVHQITIATGSRDERDDDVETDSWP
jgi:hypothetical protein